jgi:TRAP transporter TAXI family solute receptor
MLTDGIVDAVFVGGSIPHVTILSATASHELQYLEFNEAALDKVEAEYPFIKKFTIPSGTYKGMDRNFLAVDSGTTQLLVHENADPAYIYLVAKTIYENRGMAAEMHPALKEITPERAAMDIGIPYHEGSLRFFTEIGIWKPRPASD